MISQATRQTYHQSVIALTARLGGILSLENQNLDTLWLAAIALGDGDLAWRCATVIAARETLSPKIKHAWEISGEKRSIYAANTITAADVECCLSGFNQHTSKALSALIILGFKIVELAEISAKPGTQAKQGLNAATPLEAAISKVMTHSDIIPKHAKTFHEYSGIHSIPPILSSIQQISGNNPWVFTVRVLLDRLSAPCWNYNKRNLYETTSNILPLVGAMTTSQIPAKIGRWLTGLSSPQRAAWNELSSVLNQIEDSVFNFDLARFTTRLALLIYPAHYLALKSLQDSSGNLSLLRDLEAFIISPEYSKARTRLQIKMRVLIPQSLQGVPIIKGPSVIDHTNDSSYVFLQSNPAQSQVE